MAGAIEDYALLGNCRSAALVGRDGSLDWLCFPRFDSPACFAALLGSEENGRWQIAPREAPLEVTREYQQDTLILHTTFVTASGRARLIDCMPLAAQHSVVRIVEGLEGEVEFDMDLVMRFDYGSSVPWVEKLDPLTLTAVAGPDRLTLRSTVGTQARDHHTGSRFTLRPGQRHTFSLTHQPSHLPLQPAFDPEQALDETAQQWRAFADRCPEVGANTARVDGDHHNSGSPSLNQGKIPLR